MMQYDAETKTVYMTLVDLEHCGFRHSEYLGELFLAGLDRDNPDLQWPETLVVVFKRGAVVTGSQNVGTVPGG